VPQSQATGSVATWGRDLLTPAEWLWLAQALRLSMRQLEVVRFVFDDAGEAAMARQLSISHHTVHTHLERLYRKLGVSSRCELLVRVFREALAVRSQARSTSVDARGAQRAKASERSSPG